MQDKNASSPSVDNGHGGLMESQETKRKRSRAHQVSQQIIDLNAGINVLQGARCPSLSVQLPDKELVCVFIMIEHGHCALMPFGEKGIP